MHRRKKTVKFVFEKEKTKKLAEHLFRANTLYQHTHKGHVQMIVGGMSLN